MLCTMNITTDLTINKLEDLRKLKPFLEERTLKINKSQLARELGKDRRTIHKYLNGYEKPVKREKTSCIDAYYNQIKELLSDNNQQIFYYKRILWQYLVDNHGLTCKEPSFRRYISNHPEFQQYFDQRGKKHLTNKTHIRYETAPASQAQLDWKESIPFTLKNGETLEVNILVLLLSYSRYRIYHVSLKKTQDVLLALLDQSFEQLQGVPKTLLVDNMKTIMDEPRTPYQRGKVNRRFQQFADDYEFQVKPCLAGRPQTKAKVEAPMKLLDEIRAYNGQLTYPQLIELVTHMNNRINSKVNQGTGKIPLLFYQKEKVSLSSLPKGAIRKPYQITTTTAKVNSSSMITYKGNQYSVPAEYLDKTMNLQVHDGHLCVYYNMSFVTMHPISSKKLNYLESHYLELSRQTLPLEEVDIKRLAKENLNLIGAMYKDEQHVYPTNKKP